MKHFARLFALIVGVTLAHGALAQVTQSYELSTGLASGTVPKAGATGGEFVAATVGSDYVAPGTATAFSAQQTFASVLGGINLQTGTTYTIAATDCGKTLLFTTGTSPVVTIAASIVPASGTSCVIGVIQGGSTKVSVNGSAVSAASLVSSHSYTGTSGTIGSVIDLILTTVSSTATAYLTGDGS